MTGQSTDPLFGPPPLEIALSRAPLVRVLAQVSFNPILVLRSEDKIAPFQDSIRATYPKVSHETIRIPPLLPGETEPRTEVTWRFLCPSSAWRVSVTTHFLALETTRYVSRADLLARVRDLVGALKETVKTIQVGRIGVRYVDQVRDPELGELPQLVRPEMLGIFQAPLARNIQHAFTETVCNTAEGGLIARWGNLPANGTYDPNVMAPISSASWFLDIDAFSVFQEPEDDTDVDTVCRTAMALTERSYTFFRWAVTDRFLDVYGRQS